ncbi:hypothetical protein B0H14DRAFT_2251255, partial [Mycena olivaceomarginata]
YHCAQSSARQHKPKKNSDVKKQRDKGQMRTFACQGWLTVWASPDSDSEYLIRIRHDDCHEKYVCIDVPDDVKSYIKENSKMRSFQVSSCPTSRERAVIHVL